VTFRPDVVVRALVDTGTDTCVFHANLLERIGLKLKDGNLESITAGRASLPVYYFDLRIGVDGLGAFETCIGFSDRVRPEYGLLWIYGFLDRLDAEFCEDYFILKRRGESR